MLQSEKAPGDAVETPSSATRVGVAGVNPEVRLCATRLWGPPLCGRIAYKSDGQEFEVSRLCVAIAATIQESDGPLHC